jgi:Tfp pilus assembly protein PilX
MRALRSGGRRASRQRGAALIVGLILLVILTLLAFAGSNTAITELVMAGNEQFRRNAALAAQAGIERAITRLAVVPTAPGAPALREDQIAVPGSPRDSFSTATRYTGQEKGLPQFSLDRFVGEHFEIESTGRSVRNAADLQRQGVFVVTAASPVGTTELERRGTGLP